jgi:hypothetical protein
MINFSNPKHLFCILLIVLLLPIIYLIDEIVLGQTVIGTYGVNKTIGWAWDFCAFIPVLFGFTFVLTFTGFGVLTLVKAKLSRWISVLQMVSIASAFLFLLIIPSYEYLCNIRLMLSILSLILLFVNIGFSIGYKMSDKNKRLDD